MEILRYYDAPLDLRVFNELRIDYMILYSEVFLKFKRYKKN